MKRTRALTILLAATLTASIALAQTNPPGLDGDAEARLAAARSAYVQPDVGAGGQVQRFPQRPTLPPQRPLPPYGAPSRLHNQRPLLIGAMIGFGLGAAAGAAANKDDHTNAKIAAPLLGGSVGAALGAGVGYAFRPVRLHRSPRPPRSPRRSRPVHRHPRF